MISLKKIYEQDNPQDSVFKEKKVKVFINGEKTDVIFKYKLGSGLEDVTISWSPVYFSPAGDQTQNVEFEFGDVIDDHGNEGRDEWWEAESDGYIFYVDIITIFIVNPVNCCKSSAVN